MYGLSRINHFKQTMVISSQIYSKLKSQLPQLPKDCGISFPVIRKQDNTYFLACFITILNPHDLSGYIPRPEYWVLATLDTVEVISFHDCTFDDFSASSHERSYNILSEKESPKQYKEEFYSLLDKVRIELLETNILNRRLYKQYLKKITQYAPISYRKFLRDLSV